MTTTRTDKTTHTLGEGDTTLTYDIWGDLGATELHHPLFVYGSPMDASAFASLVEHITDRPVITYDPRGSGRNPAGTSKVTPEDHADDLRRVIEAVGVGAVDVLGTSGGAVNTLALAAQHPDVVRRVVIHEPPVATPLPDRDTIIAAVEDLVTTYQAAGEGTAMAKFTGLVMQDGPLPEDYLTRPAPDPAEFGMSADDDGTRTNPLIRSMPACQQHVVDVDALQALGDRVVIAVGEESHGEYGGDVSARGGRAVAELLGLPVTSLPGNHIGFAGVEYGRPADGPESFATALLKVLG